LNYNQGIQKVNLMIRERRNVPMKATRTRDLLLGLVLLLILAPHSPTVASLSVVPVGIRSPAADGWEAACVDCPPWFQNMSDRSLQVDGEGHPHIAFGGDHLYHAWHDGTGWQIEVVPIGDVTGVGAFATLALDGAGRTHISCHDETNGNLIYAWHDGAAWQTETVDEVGNWYGHGYSSLAVTCPGGQCQGDGENRPHVSYYDYEQGQLKYAWRDETEGWQVDETFLPEQAGEYGSLALDGLGRPHVVYLAVPLDPGDRDGDLRYAWHDGSSWQYEFEAVEQDVNLLGYPSLAVDESGRPHVVYVDGYLDYDLRYARLDAGEGWQIHTVDDAGGWYPSLALNGSGHPHVSYHVAGELRYAWSGGTTWQVASLSTSGVAAVGWGTAIALDPDSGLPHVAYRNQDGDLRHIWRGGTAWKSERVVRSRDTGGDTSLALDGADRPHISYHGDGLRYAWLDGTVWQMGTVDGNAYVGGSTSLALDDAGLAHISYHDWSNGDLKYARHNGTTWLVAAVDRAGYVGEYSSLALDGSGRPHISYFDRNNGRLKYARLGGTLWLIETVPLGDATHAGMYSSLALDAADHPHISCEAHGDLIYTWHDGATWQVEMVDEVGVVGRYSSLALDGSGLPHVSYYDATSGRLKYAWRDQEGAWHVETVPSDTAGRVGRYTSLALDEWDQPHVSYYDESEGDLKYTWHDGSDWHVETVSTGGDVGYDTALALDGMGQPHVSYYDAGGRDLRYTWRASHQIGGSDWQVYLPVVLGGD
jgi:hypothetical protein